MSARCAFYVRRRDARPGKFTYEQIEVGPDGFSLPLDDPAAVGDLVWLHDRSTKRDGTFRVVERSWRYAQHESTRAGMIGPLLLDLILEPADAPFRRAETGEVEA